MPDCNRFRFSRPRDDRPSPTMVTVKLAANNAGIYGELPPAAPALHVSLVDLRHIYTFLFFGLYSSFPAGVTTASAFRCASMIWRCTWGGWNIIGAQGAASYITRT